MYLKVKSRNMWYTYLCASKWGINMYWYCRRKLHHFPGGREGCIIEHNVDGIGNVTLRRVPGAEERNQGHGGRVCLQRRQRHRARTRLPQYQHQRPL
jgi:hypothetical protein